MTFASITLPAVELRFILIGPPGAHLEALVAAMPGAGVGIECVTPGTTYRLHGSTELLDVLADELAGVDGFTLERETGPVDTVRMSSTLAPLHPFRRSVVWNGCAAARFVARAVDLGLTVATVGVNRWAVSARTSDLVQYLATVYGMGADEVLSLVGWSEASVLAEDSATPTVNITLPTPTVNITLPDRRTTSDIRRNAAGDIINVVQLETTA